MSGLPEIRMVPETVESAKCRLCHGRQTVTVLDVSQAPEAGFLPLKSYPCPICQPLWWRDNPESPIRREA